MPSLQEIVAIARVCHEANRAYCISIGDRSQPCWGAAEQWQHDSAINGVQLHIEHPDTTPEQSHENWCEHKIADGWKHGPVKDAEKKEHPCLVPYAGLPEEQRAKDRLFGAIVTALVDGRD